MLRKISEKILNYTDTNDICLSGSFFAAQCRLHTGYSLVRIMWTFIITVLFNCILLHICSAS